MIWGSDGTLLGKVQDDGLANPEELEGYPLNEKGEVLDEDGQKIGQARVHETLAGTRFRNARDHKFYKMKPDEDGRYHCPYAGLEMCSYRPQMLKSTFDKHVDWHLKPYRCNFGECVDTQFSSTGYLLRHEREIHRMHGNGAKAYLVHNYNGVEPSKEALAPSYSKTSSHGDRATHRPKDLHVSSQDCDRFLRNAFEDEGDLSEHSGGAHVLTSPATVYDRTPSSVANDNVGSKGFEFFDTHHGPKKTIASEPRDHPKPTTSPTSINPEQPKEAIKEHDEKITVDVDFLHKLELKIGDLQSRVEACEVAPGSPSNSSICDSEDSLDSVSDHSHKGGRATRYSQSFDDEIISHETEAKKGKRGAEGPSLQIARWNHLTESQRYEAVRDEISTPPVLEIPVDRPLLTAISEYHNNQVWRRRVEIASPAFFDLLKEVSRHNISDNALHEGTFYLMEPLMVLFLNRKQLTDYVVNTDECTQAKDHAKFILNFMKSDFSDVSRVLDNFESNTPPNLVKYCDLWMLYRPGTKVYSRANGEWEAFVIDSLDGMQIRKPSQDNCHSLTRLDIRAWSMDFDGEVYGRVWSIHCIAPFHGVRAISFLPLVPEKFLLDGNVIRESLVSRGKAFYEFQEQHHQESEVSPSESTRVMVDHLTYQRRNGWLISIDGKYGPSSDKDRSWMNNRYSDWDSSSEAFDRRPRRYTSQRSLVRHFEDEYCSRDYELESIDKPEDTQAEPCRRYSTDRPTHIVVREFGKYDLIRPDAEMSDLALTLLPQYVRGFCFRDKVWKFLNVSQLKPPSFQKNAWDRLVLDEDYKDILEAMVSSHFEKVAGMRISAAGKGLCILLHGEPGVGKTLTAESIAEHFGKPLFPVTCSDVGTSLSRFDEKLEEISDYATKWGAILLFDEADVLLQARRDYECANLKRNDLVSSFVRFIEYYQGIVFITTSRVSRFDPALMPRIDITLGLPSLDRGRRVGVWRNHIQHLLAEGSIDASQSADLCMRAEQEWSKQKMNGHQIKKAVNAARVLADKKGGTLGTKEVETMLKMEREFEERAGHLETEKEQEEKTGTEKEQEKDDLDGFEQVERV
ncbi:MAG: hypothetical protein ASARMPREDX12_004369 [Alectoria sarmentosa]|nr:MAG: hypothetical protein ASARMPREDX12_004369 [Alectoria sarmentosa]